MVDVFINYLRLFKNIPPADAAIIESELSYRKVPEGEVLLNEGDFCREMFFICKGVLRIVSQNEKGNKMAYFFTVVRSLIRPVAATTAAGGTS